MTAALGDAALRALARDALLAWQPILRALLEGNGGSTPADADAVRSLVAFLDALAPAAEPALGAALVRERALHDVDAWVGLPATAVLAEVVEHASCDEAATLASARCRFAQVATLVERLVPPGKLARRLVGGAAKGVRHADAAADAERAGNDRRTRAALRKAAKAAARLERRLGSRAAQKAMPSAVAAMLAAEAAALRTDVTTLRDG